MERWGTQELPLHRCKRVVEVEVVVEVVWRGAMTMVVVMVLLRS